MIGYVTSPGTRLNDEQKKAAEEIFGSGVIDERYAVGLNNYKWDSTANKMGAVGLAADVGGVLTWGAGLLGYMLVTDAVNGDAKLSEPNTGIVLLILPLLFAAYSGIGARWAFRSEKRNRRLLPLIQQGLIVARPFNDPLFAQVDTTRTSAAYLSNDMKQEVETDLHLLEWQAATALHNVTTLRRLNREALTLEEEHKLDAAISENTRVLDTLQQQLNLITESVRAARAADALTMKSSNAVTLIEKATVRAYELQEARRPAISAPLLDTYASTLTGFIKASEPQEYAYVAIPASVKNTESVMPVLGG